jgi:hypothetical protein
VTSFSWLERAPLSSIDEIHAARLELPVKGVNIADIEHQRVHGSALLLQTGLLTLSAAPSGAAASYALAIPNDYARRSIETLLASATSSSGLAFSVLVVRAREALLARDYVAFSLFLMDSLGNVPGRMMKGGGDWTVREAPYHALLLGILLAMPNSVSLVVPEQPTSAGFADLILHLAATSHSPRAAKWIIELGVASPKQKHGTAAAILGEKLEQAKGYADGFRSELVVAGAVVVDVSNEARGISVKWASWDPEAATWTDLGSIAGRVAEDRALPAAGGPGCVRGARRGGEGAQEVMIFVKEGRRVRARRHRGRDRALC